MKKNLLTLSLVASVFTYAQDTYIGTNAVVKVQPNTLFYNGGNVTLSTDGTQNAIVKNDGNIIINQTYKNNGTESKGEHFVNTWTDSKNYGQVIINGSSGTSDGKLTMQKKSVASASIQQLPISIPFKGKVESIMRSFPGKDENNFRGNCQKDTQCGQRYWMTLFSWDNEYIVNDAVVKGQDLVPGSYYLLNIISNTGLNTFYDGINNIDYKGQVAPEEVNLSTLYINPDEDSDLSDGLKTKIHNLDATDFEGKYYDQWKNLKNKYQETYRSYLGNGSGESEDLKFGKNMFRFGNPYTSNLDLSDPASWMTTSPVDAIKNFVLTKLSSNYEHTWNNTTGSSHNSTQASQYLTSAYVNNRWTGESEPAIIRPLEMFNIKFSSDNLVAIESLTLNNTHKTFSNIPVRLDDISPRSSSNDFSQLKIMLVDNNHNIISEPVFLANSNDFETGANIFKAFGNKMLLLEEDLDGSIIANAKSIINTFNSEDYIGKPLNLELNNLPVGSSFKLRFNLKENNIFTESVNELSNGNKFFIHDKVNDTFTEINSTTVIDINVTEDTANQFAFYWNATPRTLGTGEITKTYKTQVYKYAEDVYKVKFDSSKTLANVEVYNVNGAKASTQNDIQVNNNDYTLKLPNGVSGLFIVKVMYSDGTINNIKVLVD